MSFMRTALSPQFSNPVLLKNESSRSPILPKREKYVTIFEKQELSNVPRMKMTFSPIYTTEKCNRLERQRDPTGIAGGFSCAL